jgi:hypothetical protein
MGHGPCGSALFWSSFRRDRFSRFPSVLLWSRTKCLIVSQAAERSRRSGCEADDDQCSNDGDSRPNEVGRTRALTLGNPQPLKRRRNINPALRGICLAGEDAVDARQCDRERNEADDAEERNCRRGSAPEPHPESKQPAISKNAADANARRSVLTNPNVPCTLTKPAAFLPAAYRCSRGCHADSHQLGRAPHEHRGWR